MDIYTPTKSYLETCNLEQLAKLAEQSGVPESTLYKIRSGQTGNPGVKTVQKIWPYIPHGKHKRRLSDRRHDRRRTVIKAETP
jgi:predicted transcriptional regulator